MEIMIKIETKIKRIVKMSSLKSVELVGVWIWTAISHLTFFDYS